MVRISSTQELDVVDDDKNRERESTFKDRIGLLPDHILITILVHLTLKERARVSAVCKRWRPLFAYTSSLNFDGLEVLFQCFPSHKLVLEKRPCFIDWVSQILKLHKATIIDEFMIRFDLDKTSANEIDNWLHFALSRRVQRLEFNFDSKVIPEVSRCYTLSMAHAGSSCIKSLTSVSLTNVDVTAEVLEHFLSNCPNLERLLVNRSVSLLSLKVAGPSPFRLKHLEIQYCQDFGQLEICAPNLVYFGYLGRKMRLHIVHAPSLIHVYLSYYCLDSPTFVLLQLLSFFSQLQILHLDFSTILQMPNIPELTNLKHLVIGGCADSHDSLLWIDPLLKACPSLQKLSLRLMISKAMLFHQKGFRLTKEKPTIIKTPHQSLKIVEIMGFVGYTIDFQFLYYIFETAIVLEKLIIDRRKPYSLGTPWEFEEDKEKQDALQRALQLKRIIPASVEVVII
ncbi:F-box/LRR-repeat protein At3g59210 [Jatropha curcas]|uniref:F-box/LRR-repeat protein At3g59210 n=1 Tax=Jatropha curcas TaxID=180498 RepID=UPI001893462B|nr:F-box/LRR-repeat protein At3g59210 [Jatropha curcas]